VALPPDEEKLMTKKQAQPRETKSDFVRRALDKNPNLDYHQVNQKWTKAGHEGQISEALYYLVRRKMGIQTVWTWAPRSEPQPARAAASRRGKKTGAAAAESTSSAVTEEVYQLKITLPGIEPPIWRRIQAENCSLDMLHHYIQDAMGWTNSHLHHFQIGKQLYGDPTLMADNFEDMDYRDSTQTKLSDILPRAGKQFRFMYEYDFGDSWQHEILFEGRVKAKPGQEYPICQDGHRACPPEDVGGIWGYADFLEAIGDPDHDQHQEMKEWVGGKFDPEEFSPAMATLRMQSRAPARLRRR
jgi:hypothetical protein